MFAASKLLVCLAFCGSVLAVTSFTGANNFYIPGLPSNERKALLQGMSDANMKVLRIFVQGFSGGRKGSSGKGLPDVEPNAIGTYDDTILNAIDDLMIEAHDYGVKLILSLYDKNTYEAGGVYQRAYPNNQFYTNSQARVDYNNRITHILNGHKHRTLGKPWSELGQYIFGYDTMNEPHIGDTSTATLKWICQTGKQIRGNIGDRNQLVLTGGGSGKNSVQDYFFGSSCGAIDVVAIHDYNGDFDSFLPSAISKAKNAGKKLIVEEWGSLYSSSGRLGNLRYSADQLKKAGVPWLYWELITNKDPHEGEDYEIQVGGDDWSDLVALSKASASANGVFDFSGSLAL